MVNQPYERNPAEPEKKSYERKAAGHPPTVANLPTVPEPSASLARPPKQAHQCSSCGAWAAPGSSVCTACGARLQPKPQKIRCRLCGATASTSLVICPRCGRELHAAPSRVLSWGAPSVLILLFLVVMIQRWESGSLGHWVQAQVVSSRDWVNQLAEQLDPQITISTLPDPAMTNEGEGSITSSSAAGLQQGIVVAKVDGSAAVAPPASLLQESPPTLTTVPEDTSPIAQNESEVALATVTPTETVEQPSATPTPVPPTATAPMPTATDTATVVPTVAATATSSPTPVPPTVAPTATATPRRTTAAALVDTSPETSTPSSGIGGAVTAADAPSATVTASTVTILQPTLTLEPTLEPTPTSLPTATPTQAATTYTIRAGDTPLAIANEFGISVDELMAYNGLSLADTRRLRVGQVLIIPTDDASATATPSSTPVQTSLPTVTTTAPATATTVPATAVADTATTALTIRLDAPTLRSPESGSSLSCSSAHSLIWLPTAFIRENDQYLLHLGFLSGYNGDGSEQVTWVLEQWQPANATLWDLDSGLCGLAPQDFGRQWRWYVEVMEAADGGWRPVSSPSQIWGFSWN